MLQFRIRYNFIILVQVGKTEMDFTDDNTTKKGEDTVAQNMKVSESSIPIPHLKLNVCIAGS